MTMNPNMAIRLETHDADNRAIALPSVRAVAPHRHAVAVREAARPAVLRQRFKLGPLDFDYRAFPRQRVVALSSTDATVHIVMPITGTAVVVTEGKAQTLSAGSALLLGAITRTAVVCAAGSSALFLHIPRAAIQSAASRVLGSPRRLAAIDHLFGWSLDDLGAQLPRASVAAEPGQDDRVLEQRTLDGLVKRLREDAAADTLFPVARSVQRAVEHIRANPQHSWTINDLAPMVGVTPGTLRRNFRTCLGNTVTQLVQQIRIEWVRARLESVTESRSISDIALAAGFGAPGVMSRTYQRHFGETPSKTRARAFRAMRD
ncbi:AraC family transcriptional regulator [Tsuneonella sp. CC-YZS046]|nr:AraC family transcriptional regulator [Tsuneonella sp. CC-YZS046]WRO66112.1 AraC family transcriptional regulator [Tsuneonella sp. CC-YZS046]